MNLGPLIALLKLLQDSGIVSPPPATPPSFRADKRPKTVTPPTSEAGVRPACGAGEKAVFFKNPDRYECVPKFK